MRWLTSAIAIIVIVLLAVTLLAIESAKETIALHMESEQEEGQRIMQTLTTKVCWKVGKITLSNTIVTTRNDPETTAAFIERHTALVEAFRATLTTEVSCE